MESLIRTSKAKENGADDHSHDILILFDVWTKFLYHKRKEAWLLLINMVQYKMQSDLGSLESIRKVLKLENIRRILNLHNA